MKIIGREKEIKIINKCFNSNQSEFIALYGRRRVGKTYLVNNCFNNNFDFKFTATYHTKTADLLESFQIEINKTTGRKSKKPSKWNEAFSNLGKALLSLNKKKGCCLY